MKDIYTAHAEWSEKTFGSDRGPLGPLKHLIKEAEEAAECPEDPHEFADCIFLVFDAARRAGHDYDALAQAMLEKLEILKRRQYQKVADGEPSFHIKKAVDVRAALSDKKGSGA
ncbi:dATP/dGTP pyrophosphohydrolase domain-containing protein [Halocynthiibacter namhaensis]|uniref:dATP/dGTP pyrophosphohydrolase domain-containing protein n=1 Tax=Halocynthiibacter namhaensis TaxID=1290553 RepID=UPI00068ECA00|nr:dATP/dGTP pyrophosphohydrolase domain-containing protein [Halocynthiibacter namhaensis]